MWQNLNLNLLQNCSMLDICVMYALKNVKKLFI